MKTKLVAILLLIFISLTIFGVISLIVSINKQDTPIAKNGVLDLSDWDFNEEGKVPLSGEWEFYPDQLLEPIDFDESEQGELIPHIVSVPEVSWTRYDLGDKTMDAFGKATYRLKVKIEEDQIFGIQIGGIFRSHTLFVNGELLGSSGDPDDYSSSIEPYIRYFKINNGINEIVLQVANYNFPIGGIFVSQILGTQQQISQYQDTLVINDWIAISIFSIMGFYFLGMYSQRRKDHFLLFFSLYCLTTVGFIASHGEGAGFMVFSNIPDWIVLRFQFGSLIASSLCLILYIYTVLKTESSKKLMMFLVTLGLIIFQYVILFTEYIPIWMMNGVYLYMFFSMAYVVYVMILAFLKKMEGSIYLIVGVIAMSVHFIKNSFVYVLGIQSFKTSFPFEPFILLLMFSLLMSLRFSNAFKRNEQLSEELLKIDQVKDEFLAKTSHELRTPLHGIINISSFLLDEEEGRMSKKYNENLSLIHDTSLKLSNLVNDLIDVTRLRNGEFRLQSTTVDLKVSTQIVIDVLAFEIKGKPIQLINNIEESVFVVADENRLRQILYNLIHNAIKHTEHGEIFVTSKRVDDKVYLYVEDTGIGIPEDKQEEVFGYFEQLDQLSPQDGYQSMGLGLYISRQLINKMNGEIWVDWSEVGQGTRVAFTLPKAEYSEQKGSEDTRVQPHISSTSIPLPQNDFDSVKTYDQTILIVDDESTNIQVLLNLLSKQGYNVITAFSGKEALRKMEKYQDIDLAILDVMMPVMSGIELCRTIRETHSLLELPILFATAKDRSEDIELGFKAGANDYITKPFDSHTILARMQTLLSMKASMEDAFHNEMAFLQAQIKPHFLYNAMSNIISCCYTDGQKAAHLLNHLSQYLRVIYSTNHKTMFIPLHREMDLIKAYVEIEKARFDRFDFSYQMDEGLEDVIVPSLCIQPFVENAIRHGLFRKKGEGQVTLTILEKDESIEVVIEDNGVGMRDDILKQFEQGEINNAGIGMTNIKKRLESISGSFIKVNSEIDQGSKVTLRLPKMM
ncbi:ATP-binding protein [Chengkuizengella sediminis]|uniref:hybrid sensor histidine kinase/response regulator n=1 Tax=Chengkuizengella sediminis TaxID=1885917 RepID=UPI001389D7B7|nr:ATP-binding protein [Chengkuizengella sediminis]NDI35185.1 response regulator [Chengkuizengella sediminis]